MRSSIATLIVLAVLAGPHLAVAQDTQEQHQQRTEQTEPASGSRFRIIQSDIAAKLTFRLDRYTGMVSQLVKDADGNHSWEAMTISPIPIVKTPDHPHFQIFTSGIAVRFTFLIDNDTGKTWQFVKVTSKAADGTESEFNSWQLMPE